MQVLVCSSRLSLEQDCRRDEPQPDFLKSFQSAYLIYYGMAAFAGRSLMTEAVRLTTDYAFGKVGLHRLEVNIQPANLPSIALVERVGFRKKGFSPRYLRINGIWCDHEPWALLTDDAAT